MQLEQKEIDLLENKYIRKWFNVAVSTNTGDPVFIENKLQEIYKENDKAPFKFFLMVDSPLQASNVIRYLLANADNDERRTVSQALFDKVKQMLADGTLPDTGTTIEPVTGYGQFDCYWLPYYDFLINEKGYPADQKIINFIELSDKISYWWSFEDVAIVSKKIEEANIDYKGDLNNKLKPILKYSDGYAIYYFDGRKMSFEEWNEKTVQYRSSLGKVLFGGFDNKTE